MEFRHSYVYSILGGRPIITIVLGRSDVTDAYLEGVHTVRQYEGPAVILLYITVAPRSPSAPLPRYTGINLISTHQETRRRASRVRSFVTLSPRSRGL